MLFLLLGVAVLLFTAYWGIGMSREENSREPVVLTLWHNPGGQMKHAMSDVVDEFNRTVGKEKGIVVVVTSIGKFEVLHEKLELIANGDPGAPEPPDIAIAYPKSAILLVRKNLLVDIGPYFNEQELSAFVPRFLEEGRLADGKLYLFPVAKSTEALLVNRTLFDRFAAGTGVTLESLRTVEGLLSAARKYYEWTGGKMFFMIDNPFNFAQVAYAQLGDDFFLDGVPNVSSPSGRKVWNAYYEPAVKGYEAIYSGYGTDLTKTGDIVCWTSSTAATTFLPSTMTYADNSSEPVAFDVLPYPVFEGGKKVTMQRAGGFCLFKSTARKERAAIVFLKWLVEPEQNLRFLAATGYLPVTKEAMRKAASTASATMPEIQRRFLEVTSLMQAEYDFLIPRLLEDYRALEKRYEAGLRKSAQSSKEKYERLRSRMGADKAYRVATEGVYERFKGD